MFVISKIVGLALDPGWWLLLALLLALLFGMSGRRRAAGVFAAVALAVTATAALTPAGAWLLQPLEARFPRAEVSGRVDGVVLLGGMVDPVLSAARGEPQLNAAAERITEFVRLSRLYPEAKLIFTGGSGSVLNQDFKEALVVRALLEDLGVPLDRVMFDNRSRNTHENAVQARILGRPATGERWLLLTSAMHMPRSVGCFRAVGFPVEAHPVDYRTRPGAAEWVPGLAAGAGGIAAALHEWVGLVAYYLLDRTDALFPAP